MSKKEIMVTLSQAVQCGENEFKQVRVSRGFAISRPIEDMLSWATAQGIKNATINDLIFSEYTGSSI